MCHVLCVMGFILLFLGFVFSVMCRNKDSRMHCCFQKLLIVQKIKGLRINYLKVNMHFGFYLSRTTKEWLVKGSHVMDIFHYHRSVTNFLGTTTYHFVGQLVCGLLAFWPLWVTVSYISMALFSPTSLLHLIGSFFLLQVHYDNHHHDVGVRCSWRACLKIYFHSLVCCQWFAISVHIDVTQMCFSMKKTQVYY